MLKGISIFLNQIKIFSGLSAYMHVEQKRGKESFLFSPPFQVKHLYTQCVLTMGTPI